MQQITSAAANKLLKSLEDEKEYLLSMEAESSTYVLAEEEKEEPPHYDYEATQHKIDAIDTKIRIIKHAVNTFNIHTILDGLDITIDQALVEMAQLNRKKHRLDTMRKRLPKTRLNDQSYGRSKFIEYQYINYDLEIVQNDYQAVCDRITALQIALDLCNQTKAFNVNI